MPNTFDKYEVLTTLRANREQHRAIFVEALEGYRVEAIKQFNANIKKIEKGKLISYVSMRLPEDHTKDYDRVISLFEHSLGEEVSLTEEQFIHYFLDDWDWKRQFLTTNSTYSSTASKALSELEQE